VEVFYVHPDDMEAFICSESQRSGSTAPLAKRAKEHKAELVEIARERLEEQQAQTGIISRMADSQAQFQTDLLTLLRKSKNSDTNAMLLKSVVEVPPKLLLEVT